MLVGRHTYEVTASQENGAAIPPVPTYVFSRTLRGADHPNVTVVSDGAPQLVDQLRKAPGKDIWLMGGGILFRSLLDAGLVDDVEIGLVPILLGEGIPMLPPMPRHTTLTLTGTMAYPSGIVMLNYDVVRGEA